MSNYPPGTSVGDPNAPWNQPEGIECEDCLGEGVIYDQTGTPIEECGRCDGDGYVPPPTREEIAQEKAEIDADRRLSE